MSLPSIPELSTRRGVTERELLNFAIIVATSAHAEQVDAHNEPYIFHPLRVMGKVPSLELKIVAVLHDVLEDTSLTAADLLEAGLPHYIVDSVVAMSKMKDEDYASYLVRLAKDPLALEVKLADIDDNQTRPQLPNKERQKRNWRKYQAARKYLEAAKEVIEAQEVARKEIAEAYSGAA